MDKLIQDLRYAIRKLRTAPGFTLAAVSCIAIGVGANTALFSLVNDLMLRPVPGIEDPHRLLDIGRSRNGEGHDSLGWMTFADLRDGSRTTDLAAWTISPLAIGTGDFPRLVVGAQVSESYFDVLGARPALGRFFAPTEVGPDAGAAVLVLGHRLWEEAFGASPSVIGSEVTVNGESATIIGVAAPGFRGNLGPLLMDAWVPFGMQGSGLLTPETLTNRRASMLQVSGRMRDGVAIEEARADLEAVMAGLVDAFPEAMENLGVSVVPLSGLPAPIRPLVGTFFAVLMALVGLVLFVACVNVASMLLARGAARSREMAVRLSMGASRKDLIRQLLVETTVLFALGGAAGIVLALWLTALLMRLDPPIPPPFDVSFSLTLDPRVLGFTLVTLLGATLVFGLGPALRASSPDLVAGLKDQASNASPRRARARSLLLAGQVCFTVLLLVMSALFLRALAYAGTLDLGFEPEGVYSIGMNLDLAGHDATTGPIFLERLHDAMEGMPGVSNWAVARLTPLGMPSSLGYGAVNAPGVEPPAGRRGFGADVNLVTGGYFDAMGIRRLAGRDFERSDTDGAERVAVINETMARGLWGEGSPVGRAFTLGDTEITVAGVVGDSKYSTLTEDEPWFIYLPLRQWYASDVNLVVRAPASQLDAVVATLEEIEPRLPRSVVAPLQDAVEISMLPQRLAAFVSGALGVVGLLLAAIGIYGVTSYATAQRTREVGLRMALGAHRGQVESMVLRQGLLAPLLGAAVGLALAVPLAMFARSFLLGVEPLDPASFGAALVTLLGAAALASWLPARRAARIDPVTALRAE